MRGIKLVSLFVALLQITAVQMQACSVCFVSKEDSLFAFYLTTAILTFIPLGMFGGIVYFIKKKSQAIELLEEQ